MNVIWRLNGIVLLKAATIHWKDSECWINGTGINDNHDEPFEWFALALEHGYFVEIHTMVGKIGQFQGSTFNLPLEVATAAARLM